MRSTGAMILSGFAAIWALVGLQYLKQPLWMCICPIVFSAAVMAWAMARSKGAPAPDPAYRQRVRRVVMFASAAEAVLILIAVNLAANTGRSDLIIAAIAIIVGLHFYLLAPGIKIPFYWLSGTALVVIGVAALLLMVPGASRDATIALAAAAVLWLSAIVVTLMAPRPA